MPAPQRLAKTAASDALEIENLSARDQPPPEWHRHHDLTYRRGSAAGKRVYSKAEQLMDTDEITPQEFAACLRYAHNYARGVIGSSSIVTFRIGGSGGLGHPSQARLDYTRAHRDAVVALDGCLNPSVAGMRPSEIMILFTFEDHSFREIGRMLDRHHHSAKNLICRYSHVLAMHYAEADKILGRSFTPATKEGARRLLDPDDKPPPRAQD